MNIGIEVTGCLTETPTGIAQYVINLYSEFEKAETADGLEAYIWLSRYKYKNRLFKYFTPENLSWHYKNYNFHRLINRLDIAHTTDSNFLNIPRTKRVATVHDLAIFQKETIDIPGYTTEEFKAKMLGKLQNIAQKTDWLITDSIQTKLDFLEAFPHFSPDRIEVIHLAGSLKEDPPEAGEDERVLRQFGVEKKAYFIFIGAISVRKNLINMIEAFKASGLSTETKFLLIGFKSMGLERIKSAIERHGLEERVILTDFIDERFMPALYRNSLGLAFATFYEGFGIPIVEAMKFKTPVMYGNLGSAPEIGGGHGVEVDPFSIGEIAAGFREMKEFKEKRLEEAYLYSLSFSWEKTAAETLDVYRKML